jgi:hypothetical protein
MLIVRLGITTADNDVQKDIEKCMEKIKELKKRLCS